MGELTVKELKEALKDMNDDDFVFLQDEFKLKRKIEIIGSDTHNRKRDGYIVLGAKKYERHEGDLDNGI